MTVCKGYLKIIWRNMGQNLMYLAIVLFVTIGMASQTEKTQENIFSRGSVDIAIVDEDGGAAAEGVVRFLRKNNSVTLTDASAEALSRKLYYREIDFVIRIPEGFTESLFDLSADNENEELIVSSVPGSTEGQFMKAELSQFLNQMRALRISGMTDEEAADRASSLADDEATVSIRKGRSTERSQPGYSYAFRLLPYLYLSVLIYAVGTVMQAFSGRTVRARIAASPVTGLSQVLQRCLAFFVLFAGLWLVSMLLPALIGHTEFYGSAYMGLYIGNSLLLLADCASVAMLAGSLVHSTQALSAMVNIIGLGVSFMCGVFVPLGIMGKGMRSVGRFLPFYWYETVNDLLGSYDLLSRQAMTQVRSAFLIQAAFVAALITVTAVLARGRRRGQV
ncbi:MAG: ABC transporter permease [Chordicoccus sp.]